MKLFLRDGLGKHSSCSLEYESGRGPAKRHARAPANVPRAPVFAVAGGAAHASDVVTTEIITGPTATSCAVQNLHTWAFQVAKLQEYVTGSSESGKAIGRKEI